jgi:flagellar biosynthesis/type III secretory pathway M-ring protein FliF/YscJ
MDAGRIVAIVIAVIVVIALVAFVLPRLRRKREERALEQRRETVVDRHREEAQARQSRAELAEKRAARERAEADLHEARARVHERGLADDELRDADDPDEVVSRRDTFADREPADRAPEGEGRTDDPVDDREARRESTR